MLDFELSRRLEVRAQVCRITMPHVGRDLVEVDEDAEDEDNVEEMSTFSVPPAPTAGASSSILCGLDVLSEEEDSKLFELVVVALFSRSSSGRVTK